MTEPEVLYRSHPAMFRNRPILFVFFVLLIPVLGIGALLLVIWFLQCWSTVLTVFGDRTMLRRGILTKTTNEVRHKDVKNIQVSQGILNRIMGVGCVGISSAGQSGIEIAVAGIPGPQKIARFIRQCQEQIQT